jgi:hypothetical protein
MARQGRSSSTVALAASTPIRYDGGRPCRAYITGSEDRDPDTGRTLWHVYWLVGTEREYVNKDPMEWRQASLLCTALNRRSGVLDGVGEAVPA